MGCTSGFLEITKRWCADAFEMTVDRNSRVVSQNGCRLLSKTLKMGMMYLPPIMIVCSID